MSRLMFVYLSGSEKGKTRIFTQNHVTLGTSDDSDLKLVPEEGGGLPNGVIAEVHDNANGFHLMPMSADDALQISVNGEPLPGAQNGVGYPLHDGDTLHFGHGLSSASVLFQVMPENFSTAGLARRGDTGSIEGAPQPV